VGQSPYQTGFTVFPNLLLEYQQRLNLDPVELNLLLQIIKHWWEADKFPFPSMKALAAGIGRDVSTVQRRLSGLVEKGLIEIEHRYHPNNKGQTSSSYTFNGLIAKATEIAEEKLRVAEKRNVEDAGMRKRRPSPTNTAGLKIAKPK
jgi:predicted transcriptional regulator